MQSFSGTINYMDNVIDDKRDGVSEDTDTEDGISAVDNLNQRDNEYICVEMAGLEKLEYEAFVPQYEITPSQLKVGEIIGHGFFSDVYMGTLSLPIGKEPVAVKMPKTNTSSSSGLKTCAERARILRRQRKLLRDEMSIMIHLQANASGHENVLKLVGAITTNKSDFCILTEYCDWGSMDEFLRNKQGNGEFDNELITEDGGDEQTWKNQRDTSWEESFESRRKTGRITTSDLMWFALQIASAMQFLIDKKILHRDIALRNILLKSDFTLKVADFGLSRKLEDGEEAYHMWINSSALPIRYMAPESLVAGTFTICSECWSFGVVIWELFTFSEHQPYSSEFENCDSSQLFFNFLVDHISSGRRLIIPKIVPKALDALITKLWHADPIQRPSFQMCRKIITQELMQSCPNILLKEPMIDLNLLEVVFNSDVKKGEQKFCVDHINTRHRFWFRCPLGCYVLMVGLLIVIIIVCFYFIPKFNLPNERNKEGMSPCQTSIPPPVAHWKQVWIDEFDSFDNNPLTNDRWSFDLSNDWQNTSQGWGNDEYQYYTHERKNVRAENGTLIIEAQLETTNKPQSSNNALFDWTSARILTSGHESWGTNHRFIVRAKLPTARPTHPAFWMRPEPRYMNDPDAIWPQGGTLNIMEYWPQQIHEMISLIQTLNVNGSVLKRISKSTYIENVADYHDYEVQVRPDRIDFFIDSNWTFGLFEQDCLDSDITWPWTNRTYHIILNLALNEQFTNIYVPAVKQEVINAFTNAPLASKRLVIDHVIVEQLIK